MADTFISTFPVPPGWSPEQAWEHHSRGERLPTPPDRWVNIQVEGGHFEGEPGAEFLIGGRLVRWRDQGECSG